MKDTDIVIIPTYNEKENIENILRRVINLYPEIEIWVVDDNSPDGTGAMVTEFAKTRPQIKLHIRSEKNGLGAAYIDILSRLKKRNDIRHIVTMDADGSHDPAGIKPLFEALHMYDMAIGSRYVRGGKISGWDKRRLALSYFGNLYSRLVTGSLFKDGTAGFVAFRAKALRSVDLSKISGSGYAYQIEFKNALIKEGKKFKEVPITFTERQLGKSKMSGAIIIEGLRMPWRILFKDSVMLRRQAIRLATGLTFFCALFFATYKLSESPSVWYDEGIYIQSATNTLLLGKTGFELSPGEITQVSRVSVSYPLIYPLVLWFKIFGTSILAARSFMVITIMTFLVIVYFLSRKLYGELFALGTLLLLVTFPPLYGNGKSVLGEVPALTYLTASLLCLSYSLSTSLRKNFLLAAAGIFSGLTVATKPIFLVLGPALIIGLCIARKRKNLNTQQCGLFILAAMIPFVAWILIQFGPGDTLSGIVDAFSNPYRVESISFETTRNLKRLISDAGPLYLTTMIVIWIFSSFIRLKEKIRIPVEEIIGFVFSIFIVFAFLRLSGAYRYLFPAQAITLVFLIPSLHTIVIWIRKKIPLGTKSFLLSAWMPVAILSIFGIYGLIFDSWVSEYYGSKKTEFWQEHFRNVPLTETYFFYDTPEVAIFAGDRNYYQYIAPNGWSFSKSDEELKQIKEGGVDRVIILTNTLAANDSIFSKHYHIIGKAYRYTILERNL